MMMIIMYYSHYTKLQRIHEKSNMETYKAAYYEALETMINHSSWKDLLISFMTKFYNPVNIEEQSFTI